MEKLKYSNWTIALQEVPGEVSLAINITGCPHHCIGCHSSELANDTGRILEDDIESILSTYEGLYSCVCLMGGDQNMSSLIKVLKTIKQYKTTLKTCVYSGEENIHAFDEALPYLNYLKIGRFDAERGSLDKQTTNQKFYEVNDNELIDRTYRFWRGAE